MFKAVICPDNHRAFFFRNVTEPHIKEPAASLEELDANLKICVERPFSHRITHHFGVDHHPETSYASAERIFDVLRKTLQSPSFVWNMTSKGMVASIASSLKILDLADCLARSATDFFDRDDREGHYAPLIRYLIDTASSKDTTFDVVEALKPLENSSIESLRMAKTTLLTIAATEKCFPASQDALQAPILRWLIHCLRHEWNMLSVHDTSTPIPTTQFMHRDTTILQPLASLPNQGLSASTLLYLAEHHPAFAESIRNHDQVPWPLDEVSRDETALQLLLADFSDPASLKETRYVSLICLTEGLLKRIQKRIQLYSDSKVLSELEDTILEAHRNTFSSEAGSALPTQAFISFLQAREDLFAQKLYNHVPLIQEYHPETAFLAHSRLQAFFLKEMCGKEFEKAHSLSYSRFLQLKKDRRVKCAESRELELKCWPKKLGKLEDFDPQKFLPSMVPIPSNSSTGTTPESRSSATPELDIEALILDIEGDTPRRNKKSSLRKGASQSHIHRNRFFQHLKKERPKSASPHPRSSEPEEIEELVSGSSSLPSSFSSISPSPLHLPRRLFKAREVRYHPRVKEWIEDPNAALERARNSHPEYNFNDPEFTIFSHAFPREIDGFLHYGVEVPWLDPKTGEHHKRICLAGSISRPGFKTVECVLAYTFIPKGPCYHRHATVKLPDEVVREYVRNGHWTLDPMMGTTDCAFSAMPTPMLITNGDHDVTVNIDPNGLRASFEVNEGRFVGWKITLYLFKKLPTHNPLSSFSDHVRSP